MTHLSPEQLARLCEQDPYPGDPLPVRHAWGPLVAIGGAVGLFLGFTLGFAYYWIEGAGS